MVGWDAKPDWGGSDKVGWKLLGGRKGCEEEVRGEVGCEVGSKRPAEVGWVGEICRS